MEHYRKAIAVGLAMTGGLFGCGDDSEYRSGQDHCQVYRLADDNHENTSSISNDSTAVVKFRGIDGARSIPLEGRVFNFLDGQVVRLNNVATTYLGSEVSPENITAEVEGLEVGRVGLSQQCIFTENHDYSLHYTYLYVPTSEVR